EFYGEAWSAGELKGTAGEGSTVGGDTASAESSDAESSAEPAEYVGLLPTNQLVKAKADAPYDLGILSHPYLMSGLAYSDTTSPIHRGVFLVRYMLGRTLRPPNEAFTPLSPDLHPDLTGVL